MNAPTDTLEKPLFFWVHCFLLSTSSLSCVKPVGKKTWAFASGRYTCPSQDLGIIMQSGDSLNWIRPYRQIIKRKPSVNSGVICKKQGHFKCVSTSISTAAAKLGLVFFFGRLSPASTCAIEAERQILVRLRSANSVDSNRVPIRDVACREV